MRKTIWGQSFDGTADIGHYCAIKRFSDNNNAFYIENISGGNGYKISAVGGDSYIAFETLKSGSSVTEAMRITRGQNILINTTSDNGHKFAVHRTVSSITATTLNDSGMFIGAVGSYGTNFWVTGDGGGHIQQGRTDKSGTLYHLYLQELGGNVHIGVNTNYGYKLYVNGTGYFTGSMIVANSITFGSDERYKTKLSNATISLETIANAPLFNYKWTDREDDKEHLGTTAQYWYGTTFRNAVIPTTDDKLWTMSYYEIAMGNTIVLARELIPIKSDVQMLKERVEKLESILRSNNIKFD